MTDKANERSDMWAGELDDGAQSDNHSQSDTHTTSTSDAKDAKATQWDVDSIRDEWTANQVRLPESLQRRFNAYYNNVESKLLMEGIDTDFRKDRHYKPLVIALGLSVLHDMDTTDAIDALDALQTTGHLEKQDIGSTE